MNHFFGSKHKTDLLDHLAEAFNVLSAKFSTGLHLCIAGDTNELKLNSILNLSSNLIQVVTKPTRSDPKTGAEAILDPVIMTLSQYYQEPLCLDPLDPDPDKDGKKSDHRIVLLKPINEIDNRCSRTYREIKVRPITKSGMVRLREWFETQDWSQILSEDSINIKAESLMSMITDALNTFLPEKTFYFK